MLPRAMTFFIAASINIFSVEFNLGFAAANSLLPDMPSLPVFQVDYRFFASFTGLPVGRTFLLVFAIWGKTFLFTFYR